MIYSLITRRFGRGIFKSFKKNQLPLLFAFLLGSLLFLGFFELADEMAEGDTQALDQQVLLLFRDTTDPSKPAGPIWLTEAVRDLTALGSTSVLVLITLGAGGFLLLNRKYRFFVFLTTSVLGGLALSSFFKTWFARPRPDIVPHLTYVMTESFPSGHSVMSAVTYLTLGSLMITLVSQWRLRFYILLFSILITILVGLTRVYLGVHYPTDVLAGWILGSGWALICWTGAEWLQERGKIDSGSISKAVNSKD